MSDFSSKLREIRKNSGLKVSEVVSELKDKGIVISDKTLYNWETGFRTPSADEFLQLCVVYGVESFSEFEETKKAPAPEGAREKEYILLDETNDLLVELGYIRKGQQLSDADLAFLTHISGLLDAWFLGDKA
jgi:transcriptional regulator with XRE-family HTH domain